MKKIIFTLLIVFSTTLFANAQSVSAEPVYDSNGKFTGEFIGHFAGRSAGESTTWYLSYKGKRVSDYFTSTYHGYNAFTGKHMRSNTTGMIWPDEVPVGHEKYVTAQIGKEKAAKDPRDND